jgi:hypothetical protein
MVTADHQVHKSSSSKFPKIGTGLETAACLDGEAADGNAINYYAPAAAIATLQPEK